MTRALWACVALVLPAACGESHEPVVVGQRDCILCHEVDYQSVADPPHVGVKPTTCGDCHMTVAWVPALDGVHPEAAFPIARGPHDPYLCLDCHDPTLGESTNGMNTDCVGCHTGDHERRKMDEKHHEVSGYVAGSESVNFCLGCHPNGIDTP